MLNPENASPLYAQLKSILKQEIEGNEYPPGSRMPSEPELSAKYGVSRVTVRRSIRELVEEGYLESKQGKGNFVIPRKVKQGLGDIEGFSDAMRKDSRAVTRAILEKVVIPADNNAAQYLQIKPGEMVLRLKRVMYEAGLPMFVDTAYYSVARFPDMISRVFENVSTYVLLREQYHVNLAKMYREFRTVPASPEVCGYLGCAPGEPLFDVLKVAYDEHGAPVHVAQSLVLASRSIYVITSDETGVQQLLFKRNDRENDSLLQP